MRFVIFDTNNLAHRFSYTMDDLANGEGRKTGVVFGITKLLISVCKRSKPDAITFVFDPIPDVISSDGKHPPEFYFQLLEIIKMLEILRINYVVAIENIIADYYIATIVNWMRKHVPNMLIDIYSNDHDFHQLVDGNVRAIKSGKMDTVMDLEAVREVYEMEPSQLPDLWALTGDRTDQIEGVRGIGEVKGTELIKKYGVLLGALGHLETTE